MNGSFNVLEAFEIDQPIDTMIFGETFGGARFVLVDATNEVVSHTNVKRATNAIG